MNENEFKEIYKDLQDILEHSFEEAESFNPEWSKGEPLTEDEKRLLDEQYGNRPMPPPGHGLRELAGHHSQHSGMDINDPRNGMNREDLASVFVGPIVMEREKAQEAVRKIRKFIREEILN